MMGRYHLTTTYTDSSRPNTPKHAKFSPPAAGIAEKFPINFRPHASTPPGPGDRTPAHRGVRRHGRRAVLPRCNSTRRNRLIGRASGAVCRMPNAMPRSPGASNAQRQCPPPNAAIECGATRRASACAERAGLGWGREDASLTPDLPARIQWHKWALTTCLAQMSKHAGVQQQQRRSAESDAISKLEPQRRRQPRQSGPGPQQQPNRE